MEEMDLVAMAVKGGILNDILLGRELEWNKIRQIKGNKRMRD